MHSEKPLQQIWSFRGQMKGTDQVPRVQEEQMNAEVCPELKSHTTGLWEWAFYPYALSRKNICSARVLLFWASMGIKYSFLLGKQGAFENGISLFYIDRQGFIFKVYSHPAFHSVLSIWQVGVLFCFISSIGEATLDSTWVIPNTVNQANKYFPCGLTCPALS